MIRLYGISVAIDDARGLVATLILDGTPDAASAAERIGRAVERGSGLVALEPRHRDTILGALEDPPEGLTELRGALVRDVEQRHGA